MNLLVDIGNSRIKWATYTQGTLAPMNACGYKQASLSALLDDHWGALPPPSRVCVSNVAAASVAHAVSAWITQHWQCPAQFCHSNTAAAGVYNGYTDATCLGVDRWLALLGAAHTYPHQALWVIDCGTAITLDYLNAQGQHQGGLILPGAETMRHSLRLHTAALSTLDTSQSYIPATLLLGKNTQDGVKFGTVYAVTALIEKVMQLGETPIQCLITGGGADELRPLLQCPHIFIADLVLRGIAILMDTRSCA
jgi:type III pantothenate kinase